MEIHPPNAPPAMGPTIFPSWLADWFKLKARPRNSGFVACTIKAFSAGNTAAKNKP
ncbi:hypothetical protein D3C73_1576540 [compost metagenome]